MYCLGALHSPLDSITKIDASSGRISGACPLRNSRPDAARRQRGISYDLHRPRTARLVPLCDDRFRQDGYTFGRGWSEIFVVRQHLQRFHTFRDQSDLWHDWHYQSSSNFAETGQRIPDIVGFAFKIAAAPFHLWAPDAYQGAPVPSAGFIASASKVASFVVLGKIVLVGFAPVRGSAAWHAMLAGWSPVLAVLAALSILVGNLVALAQSNVRRLLAYSAVAHGGYTLLGIIAGGRDGFSAALFYASVYAVTLVGAFGVVAMVRHETGGDDFSNFRGLAFRSPFMAGCMAIFMLSLAGIPPLAVFFGKFYVFSAALRATPNHGLLWLVVVALLGSFVSLYYYLIVLKAIFVDEAPVPATDRVDSFSSDLLQRSTVIGLAAAVLLLGIMPGIL